jgi:hypothetical protein
VDDLTRAVDRLVRLVAHWERARWSRGTPSRGDLVYSLVQRLADRCADAESAPRRTVPRLADTVLPDQLKVMAADLLTAPAPPDALAAALADVTETRHHL